MKNIKLVQTYSKILFDKAFQEKSLDRIAFELENIVAILEASPKIMRYFSAPIYSIKEKQSMLGDLLKKLKSQKLTQLFLVILIQNDRITYLPEIYNDFMKKILLSQGKVTANIITARKISDKDLKSCTLMFEKKFGQKFVVTHKIDPTVIGGMILTFGSTMLDLSVLNIQSKLSREVNEI